MLRLTKLYSERYLTQLIRNTDNGSDIEDALKRLDRLTQEEVQMAAAQLLRVTDTINNRLEGIAVDMRGVDDRVAGMGERVASVDERVAGVDERVATVYDRIAYVGDRIKDVDDKVKAFDDKLELVVVTDGAQYIFN